MTKRLVFGLVLVASLGANVALLLGRSKGAPSEEPPAPPATPAPPAPPAPKSSPLRPSPPPLPPPTVSAEVVALPSDQLAKRIAEAEATLEDLLPLPERFDRDEPAPDLEARLRPIFERTMGDKPYTLECHGKICKIEAKEMPDATFSDPETVGLFDAQYVTRGVRYMKVNDPGHAAGYQWYLRVIEAVHASPALAACKQANPAPGTIEIALELDAATHRVTVATGGSLANQAGGVCIRKVFEDAIAATPIPPVATYVPDDSIPIKVP